jgi:HK97 family phage prohead protease
MIKTKDFNFEVIDLTDDGKFSGYGAAFNNVDYGKDSIQPFAFSKSLENWTKSGRIVPALWQHKTDEPIGDFPNLLEDNFGLRFNDGNLWVAEAPYARIAQKGMKTKTITGMSIGYSVKRQELDRKSGITKLFELDLMEISIVTHPMNTLARVTDVKSMQDILEAGQIPSLKEFEDFLREAGFSKTQASFVAGNGLRKLLLQSESDNAGSKTLELLKSFKV